MGLFRISIILFLLLSACGQQQHAPLKIGVPKNLLNETFILPETETFAEERNVAVAVPVIPVEIELLP